ncbi:MAG: VanZ family protein [Candidatus Obscuribacterales bacterium]
MTLALLGLIFCLSAQSNSANFTAQLFGSYNYAARKTAHMVEHAALFTALYWTILALRMRFAAVKSVTTTKLVLCFVCLILTINFAVLDEWHQSFVPGRTSSATDVLWDSCGAAAACLLQLTLAWRHRTSRR